MTIVVTCRSKFCKGKKRLHLLIAIDTKTVCVTCCSCGEQRDESTGTPGSQP